MSKLGFIKGLAAIIAVQLLQCDSLVAAGLSERVVWPETSIYETAVESHWSVAAQLQPYCIVQPLTAGEVSTALKALTANGACELAVRSGGHTVWAGAANIVDGVTIDLGNMNATTYFYENHTAGILPGSRWQQVYETLDAINVSVPGGRAKSVGVGGLVLGGGNSFYSARTGLVCDAVIQFEVVLADGSIIYANNGTNPDLFKALKGGSGNFGIVTRIDLEAFVRQDLWGGVVIYEKSKGDELIDAVVAFTDKVVNYRDGSSIVFLSYQPPVGDILIIAAYDDISGRVADPAFDQYMAIQPSISSTMRVTNVSDLTNELEQPRDYIDIWYTLTFKNDARVLRKARDLHDQLVEEMKKVSDTGDFITMCMFQPLPTLFAEHSVEKGGNMLGLDGLEENAILWLANIAVKGVEQEAIARPKMAAWVQGVDDYAISIGAHVDWVYLNYADPTQKVLESYGAKNIEHMRAVAAKYDPTGVFQTRVPGGFKISKVGPQAAVPETGKDTEYVGHEEL